MQCDAVLKAQTAKELDMPDSPGQAPVPHMPAGRDCRPAGAVRGQQGSGCAYMVLRTALARRLEAARSPLHCKAWECRARCPDYDLAELMLQPMVWSCSQGCNGYDIPAEPAALY